MIIITALSSVADNYLIFSLIQLRYLSTLVKTAGNSFLLQPTPNELIPTTAHVPPFLFDSRPPPPLPQHKSLSTHILVSSISVLLAYASAHSEFGTTGDWT